MSESPLSHSHPRAMETSFEKPLPMPPAEDIAGEFAPPTPLTPAIANMRPGIANAPSYQRPKKRVAWKGKACIIALPLDDSRGSWGNPPLLTNDEVEAKRRMWEQQENSFHNLADVEGAFGTQSRAVFPSPEDIQQERAKRNINVRIPDKAEWDAYVKFLAEEKLRALGVTFGDEEPPTSSQPTPAPALSRANSQLSNLPASTPGHGHPVFSPPGFASTNASSMQGSFASPGTPSGNLPAGMHRARQSVAFGTHTHPSSPFGIPSLQPTPQAGTGRIPSPQHYFAPRGNTISPAAPNGMPNVGQVLSPVSPMPYENSSAAPQSGGMLEHMRRQQQELQAQLLRQQHQQLAFGHPGNMTPLFGQRGNTPEMMHPTPRHHRNASQALEREADAVQGTLEHSIRGQLERGGPKSGPDEKTPLIDEDSQDYDRREADILKGLDLDQTDEETNPSLVSSPKFSNALPAFSAPEEKQHPAQRSSLGGGHRSKPSVSRFNVQAKPFDPQGAFSSNAFSFGGLGIQPWQPNNAFQAPEPVQAGPVFGSAINPAASAFTPASEKPSMPSSEFKFSKSSFNVEAPAFSPPTKGKVSVLGEKGPDEPQPNKIFGEFNLQDAVKPARRSKALPIVRPDTTDEDINDVQYDEDGRPQNPAHVKRRMRRGRDDGDDEVQYAPSSPHLAETGQNRPPSQHTPKPSTWTSPGKENIGPQSSVVSPVSPLPVEAQPGKDLAKENWKPFEFKEQKDVEDFAKAEPSIYGQKAEAVDETGEKLLHEEELSDESDLPLPKVSHAPKRPSFGHKHSISSLSATAMPFVPSFATPEAPQKESEIVAPSAETDVEQETAVSVAEDVASTLVSVPPSAPEQAPTIDRKASGLQASRWAVDSSPTLPHFTSSPEIEADHSRSEVDEPEGRSSPELSTHLSGVAEPEFVDHDEASPLTEHLPDHVKHMDATSSLSEAEPDINRGESPSFEDIDAVMRAMDADPDLGVERLDTPGVERDLSDVRPMHQLQPSAAPRSDAPSPSPERIAPDQEVPQDISSNREVLSPVGLGISAAVQKLNREEDAPPSDWNDVLSADDEDRFEARAGFFDGHVHEMVGNILDNRLGPLERSLDVIQKSVALLATKPLDQTLKRPVSHDSDADDEDDDEVQSSLRPQSASYRSRSPLNRPDRRVEQMKAVVREALAAYQPPVQPAPSFDMSLIQEALAEMKLRAEQEPVQGQTKDIKRIIEDVISTHPRLSRGSSRANQDFAGPEKMKLQIDGLEAMLKAANERVETEYRERRQAESDLADAQAAIRTAEEEAAQHREAAEEAEATLREMSETRNAMYTQDEFDELQETVEKMTLKNVALETTLEEYRISHDQWREEMEEERQKTKAMRETMRSLKRQIDESTETRHALRSRFERLQDDMAVAARDLARDQLDWKRKEEEYIAKNEKLLSMYDRETNLRDKAELALEDLKHEHAKMLTFQPLYERSQNDLERAEQMVLTLREQNVVHQDVFNRLERELDDTREKSQSELINTRKDLEADITRLRKQISDAEDDAVATTSKHQSVLQELHDSKARALHEHAQSREMALEEQHRVHERALNDLRERHGRALHNSSEDRQRGETQLLEKLRLSDERISFLDDKNAHLEEKISHLSEQLEITKEAARAAADRAATSAAVGPKAVEAPNQIQIDPATQVPISTIASMPFAAGTSVPERISPQALRETIMVLQDQLQNREATIESLTAELGAVDKSLPAKLKERETEISWLRELFGVRLDDLNDIATTLTSGATFNTDAAKDAAIRLKASLQMEQQIRERHISGVTSPTSFPSLASISSQLAAVSASPRASASALPMAAAAAWGNWRKRDFSASLTDLASSVTATPSRPSSSRDSSNGLLSGLMTPPATTQSQRSSSPTPGTAPPALSLSGRRVASEARPLRGYTSNQPRKLSGRSDTGPRPLRKVSPPTMEAVEEPRTPTARPSAGDLLRNMSYDDDAEARTIMSAFGDEDTASSLDGFAAEKTGRGLRDDLSGPSGN